MVNKMPPWTVPQITYRPISNTDRRVFIFCDVLSHGFTLFGKEIGLLCELLS